MALRFTKMHGLGNDYVFVSLFDQQVHDPVALACAISDRHRGVGSDGLILIAPPDDDTRDARMIMFNADGSRAEMCGNGIRCLARYVHERNLSRRNPLRVATDAGVRETRLILAAAAVVAVEVDMGPPALAAEQIPAVVDAHQILDSPFPLADQRLPLTCVAIGNPHAIFFVPDLARVPLDRWGPLVERHPMFPARINAHFVQVVNDAAVRMITWERGSGITRACGTGASAVCVAGALTGRTKRRITATLPGGDLELNWDEETNRVFMRGPAEHVCDGVWPHPA